MSMVLSKKVPARVGLSYVEEKALREKEAWLDSVVKRKELQQGVNHDPKDVNAARKKLSMIRSQLSNYAPVRAEGQERVRIEMELKKIHEQIRIKWGGKIPTHDEYWIRPKEGGIRYLHLRDKLVRLGRDREYSELVKRWQFLRRRLEPQDSNISNTLNLHVH